MVESFVYEKFWWEGKGQNLNGIGSWNDSQKSKIPYMLISNEQVQHSGKDFIFREQPLFRLACKTLSKTDDDSCPRIEIYLWILFSDHE